MAGIKLVRKSVVIPDGSLSLQVVYKDVANPLMSSDGQIQLTSEVDETGQLIPEYPDFCVSVRVPDGSTPSTELISALLAEALESAKVHAQSRANAEEIKEALTPFVCEVATTAPVEFEGTVDLTT